MTMLSTNDDVVVTLVGVVIESCDGGAVAVAVADDDDDDGVADSSGDMSATRRIAASIMLMFVRRCDVGRSGFEVEDETKAVVDVDDVICHTAHRNLRNVRVALSRQCKIDIHAQTHVRFNKNRQRLQTVECRQRR